MTYELLSTRRTALRTVLTGSAVMAFAPLFADDASSKSASVPNKPLATGPTDPGLAPFDEMMSDFLHAYQVPGGALAVSRNSKIVYARGFGLADNKARRPVEPDSLFRIASISKPVTAVAVLQLIEKSKFRLEDRVFDILPSQKWLPPNHDQRLRAITIRQLLQHTAGWDRDKSFDPISQVHQIAKTLNKPLPVGPADVVRYTLTRPLDFDPGTRYAYSNVGYLVLGRLIAHASGQPYESYVKKHVLNPIGITRMQLGRAWKDNLAKGEVHYYDSQRREGPAVNGPHLNATVPLVFGAENLEAFEAHGGWIASAIDLVKFAMAFDDPGKSHLLKPESIHAMWSRPDGAAGHDADGKPTAHFYGCGWSVRPVGHAGRANVWHTGLIAGTSTLLVRRHDGLNWAVLFNTEADHAGKILADLIDPLVHRAADAVQHWPEVAPIKKTSER